MHTLILLLSIFAPLTALSSPLYGAAEPCDPFEAAHEIFGVTEITVAPDARICDLWERGHTCSLSEDGHTETCCTPYSMKHEGQFIPTRTCCNNVNGQNSITCWTAMQPPRPSTI